MWSSALKFQARLLRVIEEQAVRRVGNSQLCQVDVRVVAATNQDLGAMVEKGTFRRDLYFRLKGVQLSLPPLRQRREEIPHLVAYILDAWAHQQQKLRPGITRRAMQALLDCEWPGDVRELAHEVLGAVGEASGEPIAPSHLSVRPSRPSTAPSPLSSEEEAQRITVALEASRDNLSAAARRLGISRPTFYRKLRLFGLKRP